MEGALDTQIECGIALLRTADGIPVVGHLKGAYHYARGDRESGDVAMLTATRTMGVMGGGVAGFFLGGPLAAVVGGVTGGAAFDTIATVIDSVVHNEYRPNGYYASVANISKNPNAGDIFDTCFVPVADALGGYSAGQFAALSGEQAFSGDNLAKGKSNGPCVFLEANPY